MRTFHFTCATHNRRRFFQVHERAAIALETLQKYEADGKYILHAAAVMPDHIHALLTPAPELNIERVAGLIKGGISFRLRGELTEKLWQDGYHDVRMRNLDQAISAANYIRDNATEDGLKDWPFVIFRPETVRE